MTVICPNCGKDLEDKISLGDHWVKECSNPPKSHKELLNSLDLAMFTSTDLWAEEEVLKDDE